MVSGEFGPARVPLAIDLTALGLDVQWQEMFTDRPGADTLLKLLHDIVRECQAVVCIVGERSGTCPQPAEVTDAFRAMLPAGVTEASYTQWEFFFARHYKIHCPVYRADPTAERVTPPTGEDVPTLQAAFIGYLETAGVRRTPFTSYDNLARLVLRDPYLTAGSIAHKPNTLPYASLGTLFKGRDEFLRDLRAGLDGGVIGIQALHGLGGIGKTRAAIEYAHAHAEDYTALLFVNAETPEALTTGLANLIGPMLLTQYATADADTQVEAALAWLQRNPGWFLILDNVDTPDALTAVCAKLGRLRDGHVVLTSRLTDFSGQKIIPLPLDVLSLNHAAAFLLERTDAHRPKASDDETQARAVAQELGQLALALEMAGATMQHLAIGFTAYRALWRDARDSVRHWQDSTPAGYHHAVAETWKTSFDQLTPSAKRLLGWLSFLAPEPDAIPMSLLEIAVPTAPPIDMRTALANLAAFSLVTRNAEAQNFTIHRLVQDVTRRALAADAPRSLWRRFLPRRWRSPDLARMALEQALGWVNAAFTGDPQDVRTWPRLDPLAEHAEAVALAAREAGIADPTARLMDALGVLFQVKARYDRAERMSRGALALTEASRGKDHPDLAVHLNNLGELLRTTNRLGEAEPLMRRALAIDEASYGAEHRDVAIRLNNLALLLHATNRLGEAEPLMRRALAIDEASYGAEHPKVAIHLNNLAQLLKATNRLGEAEPLMRRALAIDEASYGAEHRTVATRLRNLASLMYAKNRLGEAEPLMRRALAIAEASYGSEHPHVATCLNSLARLLQDTNRLGEAEPLMRRALAIDEASYGAEHPLVAIRLNNLALLLQATNRLGEAEPLMRRHVVIFLKFQRATGHPHPHRDAAIGNYATLLDAMGRDEAAILAEFQAMMREAGLA